jgi:H+-translocating NAD(P) transhydrogenase subunit beta
VHLHLVAFAEYDRLFLGSGEFEISTTATIVLSILIGSVTFTGSLIAFGKLQGIVTGKVVKYPLQHPMNAFLLLAVLLQEFSL